MVDNNRELLAICILEGLRQGGAVLGIQEVRIVARVED